MYLITKCLNKDRYRMSFLSLPRMDSHYDVPCVSCLQTFVIIITDMHLSEIFFIPSFFLDIGPNLGRT